MRYAAASIKVQSAEKEKDLIYMSEKVIERVMAYYKSTQVMPDRIIIYRDGDSLSEGQFEKVSISLTCCIRKSRIYFFISFCTKNYEALEKLV